MNMYETQEERQRWSCWNVANYGKLRGVCNIWTNSLSNFYMSVTCHKVSLSGVSTCTFCRNVTNAQVCIPFCVTACPRLVLFIIGSSLSTIIRTRIWRVGRWCMSDPWCQIQYSSGPKRTLCKHEHTNGWPNNIVPFNGMRSAENELPALTVVALSQ